MAEYDSGSIQVLEGLEGVRKRPGMYVGDTSNGSGLHHLVWEVVGNAIDQHLLGNATELRVELSRDGWVSVRDDGPGIPTDLMPARRGYRPGLGNTLDVLEHQTAQDANAPPRATAAADRDPDTLDDEPITVLETICMRIHAGPTWDGHLPHVHIAPSMYGVGLAVVNALSERLEIETIFEGIRWAQRFERGERASSLRRLGPSSIEGTTVRFRPDPTIFSSIAFDHAAIGARLQELAWLQPHLRVYWQEQRLDARGGIGGWARSIARERGPLMQACSFAHVVGGIWVDVALAWNRNGPTSVRSFVNLQPTTLDGSHVDGMWRGFAQYARTRKSPARDTAHVREAVGCGLAALIHVGMYAPEFGSPTRDQLRNPAAAAAVAAAVRQTLTADNGYLWRIRRFLDERLQIRER